MTHCVLEEEHVPVLAGQVVQRKATVADELVAKGLISIGSTISKSPAAEVEHDHGDGSIEKNDQQNVLCVLSTYCSNRQLHIAFQRHKHSSRVWMLDYKGIGLECRVRWGFAVSWDQGLPVMLSKKLLASV